MIRNDKNQLILTSGHSERPKSYPTSLSQVVLPFQPFTYGSKAKQCAT